MSYDKVATAWAKEALDEIKHLKDLNERFEKALLLIADSQSVLRGSSVRQILKTSRKSKEADSG